MLQLSFVWLDSWFFLGFCYHFFVSYFGFLLGEGEVFLLSSMDFVFTLFVFFPSHCLHFSRHEQKMHQQIVNISCNVLCICSFELLINSFV